MARYGWLRYYAALGQEIQLNIQYAPDPPFNSGSVATAPPEVVSAVLADYQPLTDARLVTARRIRAKLGIEDSMPTNANRSADRSQVRGREACHSEDQQLDRELAWKSGEFPALGSDHALFDD